VSNGVILDNLRPFAKKMFLLACSFEYDPIRDYVLHGSCCTPIVIPQGQVGVCEIRDSSPILTRPTVDTIPAYFIHIRGSSQKGIKAHICMGSVSYVVHILRVPEVIPFFIEGYVIADLQDHEIHSNNSLGKDSEEGLQ
jgi:hypothetical protein